MAGLVLDASVVLAVVLPDESNPVADRALDIAAELGALVPCHWLLEVGNGLLMAERRKRLAESVRRKALDYISLLPFRIDDRLRETAWGPAIELASRYKLTLYDAVYLELAVRSGLPLATLDARLNAAAREERISLVDRT